MEEVLPPLPYSIKSLCYTLYYGKVLSPHSQKERNISVAIVFTNAQISEKCFINSHIIAGTMAKMTVDIAHPF